MPLWAATRARDAVNAAFRRRGYALRWIPPRALATPGGTLEPAFPLLAAHLMLRVPRPIFLNIGANDGVVQDPLYPFVKGFGWRGTVVEPLPEPFALLKRNYASFEGMTFVQAAVGTRDGESTIYTVDRSLARSLLPSVHSSFSREILLNGSEFYPDLASHIVARKVPVLSPATLLARIPGTPIDVLKIDTEGYDLKILRGFDLDRFRPRLVAAEHANLSRKDVTAMAGILLDHGYKIAMTPLDMLAYRESD